MSLFDKEHCNKYIEEEIEITEGETQMSNRENLIPLYNEYKNNGGAITPMNTESCRRYLQDQSGNNVEPEDVLWLFYNA